jgi:hypothetical protein
METNRFVKLGGRMLGDTSRGKRTQINVCGVRKDEGHKGHKYTCVVLGRTRDIKDTNIRVWC